MTIYEINRAITECVDSDTGEVIDVEKLTQLSIERNEKLEGIACWIINMDAEAKAIKEQIEILKKRCESTEKRAKSAKEFLQMNLAGEKFRTAKCSVSYRKSNAVEISENAIIPEKYMTIKTTATPDKVAIKNAIQNGEEIPGCELVERQSIQIK